MAVWPLTEHGVQFLKLMVEVPIFQILAVLLLRYQNTKIEQCIRQENLDLEF